MEQFIALKDRRTLIAYKSQMTILTLLAQKNPQYRLATKKYRRSVSLSTAILILTSLEIEIRSCHVPKEIDPTPRNKGRDWEATI